MAARTPSGSAPGPGGPASTAASAGAAFATGFGLMGGLVLLFLALFLFSLGASFTWMPALAVAVWIPGSVLLVAGLLSVSAAIGGENRDRLWAVLALLSGAALLVVAGTSLHDGSVGPALLVGLPAVLLLAGAAWALARPTAER